jgi:hypothetical protein
LPLAAPNKPQESDDISPSLVQPPCNFILQTWPLTFISQHRLVF